jgi:hypothetical protein
MPDVVVPLLPIALGSPRITAVIGKMARRDFSSWSLLWF